MTYVNRKRPWIVVVTGLLTLAALALTFAAPALAERRTTILGRLLVRPTAAGVVVLPGGTTETVTIAVDIQTTGSGRVRGGFDLERPTEPSLHGEAERVTRIDEATGEVDLEGRLRDGTGFVLYAVPSVILPNGDTQVTFDIVVLDGREFRVDPVDGRLSLR